MISRPARMLPMAMPMTIRLPVRISVCFQIRPIESPFSRRLLTANGRDTPMMNRKAGAMMSAKWKVSGVMACQSHLGALTISAIPGPPNSLTKIIRKMVNPR